MDINATCYCLRSPFDVFLHYWLLVRTRHYFLLLSGSCSYRVIMTGIQQKHYFLLLSGSGSYRVVVTGIQHDPLWRFHSAALSFFVIITRQYSILGVGGVPYTPLGSNSWWYHTIDLIQRYISVLPNVLHGYIQHCLSWLALALSCHWCIIALVRLPNPRFSHVSLCSHQFVAS